MVKFNVIEKILEMCMDVNEEVVVREFSTLAVVHFALNKNCIDILIEKGVMNIFESFSKDVD